MVSSNFNGQSNGRSNGSIGQSNGTAPYTYLHEPGFQQTHKRIIIVGGGMSGIQMAYTLSRKHKNVEFVICEHRRPILKLSRSRFDRVDVLYRRRV